MENIKKDRYVYRKDRIETYKKNILIQILILKCSSKKFSKKYY